MKNKKESIAYLN